jgi:hypothetical protein
LILKKIAEKMRKNGGFFTQNKAKLCEFFLITLDFEKNANFFAENWQKKKKIVVITSSPDWVNFCLLAAYIWQFF